MTAQGEGLGIPAKSYAVALECLRCRARYELVGMFEGCPRCATQESISNLRVVYELEKLKDAVDKEALERRSSQQGVWRYREFLPVTLDRPITLAEGNTPFIRCDRLEEQLGLAELWVKDESRNPTWSFKDRLVCVATAKAQEFAARVVVASSSGNFGASTAAYASKARLRCVIFTLPNAPRAMLTLMQVYGAVVIPVSTPQGRWDLMRRCVREYGWYPTGTYTLPTPTGNPYGVQGYKTIGYEICEQLGWRTPDRVLVPTAYGEGLFGVWEGFREFKELGFVDGLPRMVAVEPEAGGPLTRSMIEGLDTVKSVQTKPTVAFSIGGSVSSYQALRAVKDSEGLAVTVNDEEIMAAQKALAKAEGIYAEPSSCAPIAAVGRLQAEGKLGSKERIACVLTSTGLKDIETTQKVMPQLETIRPEWSEFMEFLRRSGAGKDLGLV